MRKLVCGVIFCLLCLMMGCGKISNQDSYKFKLNFDYISGEYKGEKNGERAEGTGEFTCNDKANVIEGYEGKWKNGVPNGEGILKLRDGRQAECTFKNGKLNGKVNVSDENGLNICVHFSEGRPYGRVDYTDGDGNLDKSDYYYNGILLSEIIKMCSKVTADSKAVSQTNGSKLILYKTLLKNYVDYMGSFVDIEGVVVDLVETGSTIYLLMEDDDNLLYEIYYGNTISAKFNQALVPNNIRKNDRIKVIGELGDCKDSVYEDGQKIIDLRSTIPFVKCIYLQNPLAAEDISDITEFPYLHVGDTVKDVAVIANTLIDYSGKKITYEVETKDGQKYFLYKAYKKNKKMYLQGEKITFSGTLQGNYKVKTLKENEVEYFKYPYIEIKKIALNAAE